MARTLLGDAMPRLNANPGPRLQSQKPKQHKRSGYHQGSVGKRQQVRKRNRENHHHNSNNSNNDGANRGHARHRQNQQPRAQQQQFFPPQTHWNVGAAQFLPTQPFYQGYDAQILNPLEAPRSFVIALTPRATRRRESQDDPAAAPDSDAKLKYVLWLPHISFFSPRYSLSHIYDITDVLLNHQAHKLS